jgi:myo-inositol-1(or 4)-monophosphatase
MRKPETDLAAFLPRLERFARAAGDIALRYFRPGERTRAEISYKNGGSPVTEADFAVDRYLFERRAELAPGAGWLSEESDDNEERLALSRLLVVDPIDGTRAYARGDLRWSVSVALVEDGRPVAGVVHAPALAETYSAATGLGAFLNGDPIEVSRREALGGAQIVAPNSLAPFFAGAPQGFTLAPRTPSLALRLAQIAAGRQDLAITSPNSMDWDIAAADVILTEAGGVLGGFSGAPLLYNRPDARRDTLVAASRALFPGGLDLARAALKGRS